MHVAHAWKSYRKVATQTAPPGQLVLMLYDGALRFLDRALLGFDLDDPAEANMTVHNNLHRAQEIIRELNLALDMDRGGDFASTLRGLYEYFDRLIWDSNMRKQPDGVREVIRHITVLREAWAAMLRSENDVALGAAAVPQLATA